jgi:hypothetical protein
MRPILGRNFGFQSGAAAPTPPSYPYTDAFNTVVIARGGSLTTNEVIYLHTFETSLGLELAKLDRLFIYGLNNQIAALTSFVNPNTTAATAINAPLFTPSQGFTGNGGNYINTNFAASQGTNFTLNTSSMFYYERSLINGVYCGVGENSGYLFPSLGGAAYFTINNGVANTSFPVTNSQGFLFSDRTTSTNTNGYKNGIFQTSLFLPSAVYSTYPFFSLGLNVTGGLVYGSIGQTSITGFGGTGINATTLYNAVQTLGTSIGWAI